MSTSARKIRSPLDRPASSPTFSSTRWRRTAHERTHLQRPGRDLAVFVGVCLDAHDPTGNDRADLRRAHGLAFAGIDVRPGPSLPAGGGRGDPVRDLLATA